MAGAEGDRSAGTISLEDPRLKRYPLCGPFVRIACIDGQWYQQSAFGLMNPGMAVLMMTHGITLCGTDAGSAGKYPRHLVTRSQRD
jgi:hypothetical protein